MEPTNPYAPPTTDLGPSFAQLLMPDDLRLARRGRVAWMVLFGLNTIVPLWFASNLSGLLAPAGWPGLLGAIILLVGGGLALLVAYPRLTGVAVAGAAIVAATQLVPVLQMMAGAIGLVLVGGMPDPEEISPHHPLGLVRAFVATLATGLILFGASVFCGLAWRGIGLIGQRGGSRTIVDLHPGRLHERTADA